MSEKNEKRIRRDLRKLIRQNITYKPRFWPSFVWTWFVGRAYKRLTQK